MTYSLCLNSAWNSSWSVNYGALRLLGVVNVFIGRSDRKAQERYGSAGRSGRIRTTRKRLQLQHGCYALSSAITREIVTVSVRE
ncbi:hypothetical protein E2C01_100436 [Portunus trituberculatus]|uniref:Uncharacterized protein n=1 Tax=Portunus trituberculatus TaxID=210409 RepID=A0A5B7K6X7_PORTR|nr:hypothetical protein [Portunus trituberculatus]